MASNSPPNTAYILGLDVGDKRIGVAIASPVARLPRPLQPLDNTPEVLQQVYALVARENVAQVVVGLPRGLEGQETAQSQKVRDFAAQLQEGLDYPIEFADETLSTVRAEETLRTTKNPDVSADSLAACYILEEFFNSHGATI